MIESMLSLSVSAIFLLSLRACVPKTLVFRAAPYVSNDRGEKRHAAISPPQQTHRFKTNTLGGTSQCFAPAGRST